MHTFWAGRHIQRKLCKDRPEGPELKIDAKPRGRNPRPRSRRDLDALPSPAEQASPRQDPKSERRVHNLLDKHDLKTDLAGIFCKKGIGWLRSLQLHPFNKAILDSDLNS